MRRALPLMVAVALVAGAAAAEGITRSLIPQPRPAQTLGSPPQDLAASVAPSPAPLNPADTVDSAAVTAAVAAALTIPRLRPMPAPWSGQAVIAAPAPAPEAATAQAASAPAPVAPPDAEPEAAEPAPRGLARLFGGSRKPAQSTAEAGPGGSVCGIPEIKGEVLAPIPSKVKGCGVDQPVRITAVSGIRLNPSATINCQTAIALNSWVNNAVKKTYGRREVVELKVAASYTCRPRNNVRGAKISEHGRGNAIDIAGFVLKSGREVTVDDDFSGKMRKTYKAACGIFGTTLGPGSDGYHEDHMHFDTAAQTNGPYCR